VYIASILAGVLHTFIYIPDINSYLLSVFYIQSMLVFFWWSALYKTYSITFRNDVTVQFKFGHLTVDIKEIVKPICRRDKETCTYYFDSLSLEAIKLYTDLYGSCEVVVNGLKKYSCEEFIEYVKFVSEEV
jgi:hypothetical protein